MTYLCDVISYLTLFRTCSQTLLDVMKKSSSPYKALPVSKCHGKESKPQHLHPEMLYDIDNEI